MYSFAVILWEISTGKIPFQGLSPMQVGIKVDSALRHHISGLCLISNQYSYIISSGCEGEC